MEACQQLAYFADWLSLSDDQNRITSLIVWIYEFCRKRSFAGGISRIRFAGLKIVFGKAAIVILI